jgi:hypothetical protein
MKRMQRQIEAENAVRAETRFLPTAPVNSGGGGPDRLGNAGVVPGGDGTAVGSGAHAGDVAVTTSVGAGGVAGHSSAIVREMRYVFGKRKRPVKLVRFDNCNRCGNQLRLSTEMQALVCQCCGAWKRFADMTASAMPFGDDVEYKKFTYRPITHLEDIMKCAQGAEPYVVPPQDLVRVMKALARQHIPPEALTISLVRRVVCALRIKSENAVQIYSRLSGKAARRMTAFQMDQMRIMFHTQEPAFRKYGTGRTNHLSFQYTLYK